MEIAYQISTYVWALTHICGALVAFYAWRRYRQRFFMWSGAKWALQAFAGTARDILPLAYKLPVLLVLRYGVAITGCVALYYTLQMVHRRFAHVVGLKDGALILREGMANITVQVERITDRPPPPNPNPLETEEL